ncbi:MAG: RND family transporter [Deltaproteobacteria bacterium]|nr:RND family transporter [Deltaproteobacteria bacterium]
MKRFSEALARFIERWPWLILAVALLLSAAAVPGITMLETETGFDALVAPESPIAKDNSHYEAQFGGEPITILLSGTLDNIFSTPNLAVLSEFQEQFSADERYRVINGPLTILQLAQQEAEQARRAFEEQLALAQEQAAAEARAAAAAMGLGEMEQEMAAEQARAEVLQMFQSQIEQMQLIGEPSLDNPAFVSSVLYYTEGAISPAMQSFIPDDGHALIIVTPTGNMSDPEALQAVTDIDDFFSSQPLDKVEVTIVSDAKLVDAISHSIGSNIALLLALSVAVMVLILIFMFRVRWRLLSLGMVGLSALWTFGLMGYLGVPLTMATMVVLPILIGLGIDFSIQFHNRYQEEVTRSRTVADAIVSSLSSMFPAVSIALLATIIGFITLYISKVPMIQDFGMALAIGIFISYIIALFLLHSIVYLGDKKMEIKKLKEAASKASSRIERVLLRLGRLAINHTVWIFIIAIVFAIGGGIVDHWLPTNTDYETLMPQDTPALVELRELRQIVGSGGVVSFMVESNEDIAGTEMLSWLKVYQDEALSFHPELISASSLASVVSETASGDIPAQEEIDAILAGLPPSYLGQLLSADHKMASVSFNISYISLEETHDLLLLLQEEADPPTGVRVSPVGSLALGTSTIDALVGTRLNLNLICLGAIFLVLLAVYRRLGKIVFTIIPVGAVIAWSSLDMYLIGIPINPLTAVLGVLIIGICTEFMVLLMGRYDEEKRRGVPPEKAMVTAISKIGRAITTTALTTLGGFGVLIASNFVMIRDFGIATVVSVFLSLLITITVMPGLIVWYDNWKRRSFTGSSKKQKLRS